MLIALAWDCRLGGPTGHPLRACRSVSLARGVEVSGLFPRSDAARAVSESGLHWTVSFPSTASGSSPPSLSPRAVTEPTQFAPELRIHRDLVALGPILAWEVGAYDDLASPVLWPR
jgi:hypothetical protein